MSKKKSYMDKSNIINEAVLDKVFKFLFKNKHREIAKAAKKDPNFKKRVKKFNKDMDEFTRYLKKEYPGEDPLGKNWDW